jgi:hypothetical protein
VDRAPIEQEPVDCSSELIKLEMIEQITVNKNRSKLEGLECIFVESYKQVNALNGKTCDPLFRVAKSATFILTDVT